MARLKEVDVDFISLVAKGANKQKINIYKADNSEPESQEEELKGFFNVLKSFFEKGILKKEDESLVKSFNDWMTEANIMTNIWTVNDTLVSVMRDILKSPDIKDKKAALSTAIDEHGVYLKSKLENVDSDIKKSEDFFRKEDDEMNVKEEIATALKAALDPITARLDAIEGKDSKKKDPEDTNGDKKEDKVTKEDIAEIVKSAVVPLTERLTVVEEARGISKQIDTTEQEEVKKSSGTFAGLDL